MDDLPARFSTKTELLDAIIAERKLMTKSIDKAGRDQLTLPILHDNWSVKDSIAHISEWELAMVRWLKSSLRGDEPDRPSFGLSQEQVDQINAEYYQRNRRKPLGQVLDEAQDSYKLVLDTISSVSEDDLFNPLRFDWLEGNPYWPIVAANTCWHYDEHRLIFEEML